MKRPSLQFYPGDWLSNKNLRRCTHHERGVWMDVMCLMHDKDDEYGILRWPLCDIAEAVRCSVDDLLSLMRKGVLKGTEPNLGIGSTLGDGFGKTEGSQSRSHQATIGSGDQPSGCVEYVFTPTHAGKKGEPVTLIPAQHGPIWYSSRMVLDEYVRNRRGSFGINSLDSPNHPQNTGSYQHRNQPMPTIGATHGGGFGEKPKVGIGATKGATKGATPSSSSSSSSSFTYLNPLVSYGDSSKPEVSTRGGDFFDEVSQSVKGQPDDGDGEVAGKSGVIDAFAEDVGEAKGNARTEIHCPHQEIIDLYHQMLPTLSQIRARSWEGGQSEADLRSRWREGLEAGRLDGVNIEQFAFQTREQGLEAFAAFFGIVKRSPLLMGEKSKFRANLRWLVKRANFEKTIEGTYLERGDEQIYDRFADAGSRAEPEDPTPKDKRVIVFDGGVYLFGENIVLMEQTDGGLVQEALGMYGVYGQVARVPLDKLPRKIEIMRKARLGGLVNDAPDGMVIEPHELPVFGEWDEAA